MAKIFPIIIVIVLAGMGVFLWQSGSFSKLMSFNLNFGVPKFSDFHPNVGSFNFPTPPASPLPSAQENAGSQNEEGALPSEAPIIPTSSIPAGFTRSELSPYFGEVTIGSVDAGSDSGSYNQITLSAQFATGTIDITGWTLKGNRGNEYLPKAINVYDPSGLTVPTDINFRSEDTLTLYSSTSAIGENLHLNKCIGYITNGANFTPPLYESCPAPYQDTNMSSLSGECQDYIQSLGDCVLPDSNPPVPQYDSACHDFLTTVNYKGCFNRHRSDSDFLSNQWIAWMGGSVFLDPYHDQVLLLDKKGLLVDLYQY